MAARRSTRIALLALLLVAAKPPPRAGILILDADAPLIDVIIAGVPLHLRVDLDQRDLAELNPAAAARLPVAWEGGFDADLGGVKLDGRAASVQANLAGRTIPLAIATHGRDCCAGADGTIGPLQLPYAAVRFVRAGGAFPTTTYPVVADDTSGLIVRDGEVGVQLSLARPTLASKAAGVLLAISSGGRWHGPYRRMAGPFAVERPVRDVAFAAPPRLLGFAIPVLPVRTADHGGRLTMPEDRPRPGDIVVRHARRVQHAWPVVTLGREILDGCTAITFTAEPPTLALACPAAAAGR